MSAFFSGTCRDRYDLLINCGSNPGGRRGADQIEISRNIDRELIPMKRRRIEEVVVQTKRKTVCASSRTALPRCILFFEDLLVGDASAQALSGENGEFEFGHVEPASVLGRHRNEHHPKADW